MTTYAYSNNEELFHHTVETDSYEAAAEVAKRDYPGETVYVGIQRPVDSLSGIDGDLIVERLAECAYESAGEAAEGWPDAGVADLDQLTNAIQAVVRQWLKETGNEPMFYAVEKTRTFPA